VKDSFFLIFVSGLCSLKLLWPWKASFALARRLGISHLAPKLHEILEAAHDALNLKWI
jgi:hypothetical protein